MEGAGAPRKTYGKVLHRERKRLYISINYPLPVNTGVIFKRRKGRLIIADYEDFNNDLAEIALITVTATIATCCRQLYLRIKARPRHQHLIRPILKPSSL